jgi:hypothetical protein
MDFPGFFLSAVAFTGLVFGLSVVSLPALPVWYGFATIAIGAVSGGIYLWHAKRTKYPLLDPKMMRYPLFRAGILGASNFRIGIGATPFLLPLMLQIGFGLNPFQSGMVTFVSAIGALSSKFGAQRVFRRYGFRGVLATGTLLAAIFLGINGLFTPMTPQWLIMVCLLIGGVIRSTCFTGINAMVFSDIDEADSSQATAINSVAQQISIATGVAVAGGLLDLASLFHGGRIELVDFHIAFFVVAAISALSALTFARLPRNAGAEVSGHHRPALAKE